MTHDIITHNVSRETFITLERLYSQYEGIFDDYAEKLLWWNKRINLVSRFLTLPELKKHIFHSLFLNRIPVFATYSTFIDAGTGGGLPGIPLSIVNPKSKFILNDSNHKKIFAIQHIIKELQIYNIETEICSISDIKIPGKPYAIISKHAFKINELYKLVSKLNWSAIFMLKGYPFEKELSGIKKSLNIDFYKLDSEVEDSFYLNKCVLSITAKGY